MSPSNEQHEEAHHPTSTAWLPFLCGYTEIQELFLYRLMHLLQRQQVYLAQIGTESWRVHLLNQAIYSTYRDCIEQKVQG